MMEVKEEPNEEETDAEIDIMKAIEETKNQEESIQDYIDGLINTPLDYWNKFTFIIYPSIAAMLSTFQGIISSQPKKKIIFNPAFTASKRQDNQFFWQKKNNSQKSVFDRNHFYNKILLGVDDFGG